jgi:hypothetical protein
MPYVASLLQVETTAALWAALGGIVGLVFLELLKSAMTRGREEAARKIVEDQYRAQKMAECLEAKEALLHERDTWREKYFQCLNDKVKK